MEQTDRNISTQPAHNSNLSKDELFGSENIPKQFQTFSFQDLKLEFSGNNDS